MPRWIHDLSLAIFFSGSKESQIMDDPGVILLDLFKKE